MFVQLPNNYSVNTDNIMNLTYDCTLVRGGPWYPTLIKDDKPYLTVRAKLVIKYSIVLSEQYLLTSFARIMANTDETSITQSHIKTEVYEGFDSVCEELCPDNKLYVFSGIPNSYQTYLRNLGMIKTSWGAELLHGHIGSKNLVNTLLSIKAFKDAGLIKFEFPKALTFVESI